MFALFTSLQHSTEGVSLEQLENKQDSVILTANKEVLLLNVYS